jgi:perosamine synthetase
MDPIIAIAQKYDLVIIEDATESLGARYKERMVGNLGHIACFSFNGNKLITTGGGGMIVTNNQDWVNRAKYLTTQAKDDPVEYIHGEVGFNYRLTNIQAAMGCAQMEQIDEYITIKRRIARAYTQVLSSIPGITPMSEAPWAFSVFWLYTILVNKDQYGIDNRLLLKRLHEQKVQTRPLWQPLHHSPAYKNTNTYLKYSAAKQLHQLALSLPCSIGLRDIDIKEVLLRLKAFSVPDIAED